MAREKGYLRRLGCRSYPLLRQRVIIDRVHWNFRAVSRMRNGSSPRRTNSKSGASHLASQSNVSPSGQFPIGVNSSSHVQGVANTSSPPGFTRLANRVSNRSGSGSRHSKFAACTRSNVPRSSGKAIASPWRNVIRDPAEPAGACARSRVTNRPSSTRSYSTASPARSASAAAMNAWEKSIPTTSPQFTAISNADLPTAHPRSSPRPALLVENQPGVRTAKPNASLIPSGQFPSSGSTSWSAPK